MTDPVVSIEPAEVAVEPGGQGRVTVTIGNRGSIVENYRLEVVAEHPGTGPAAWAQCFPEELSVYPSEQGTATVVLSAPVDAPSGRVPFGVKVSSTVPPHASAVAEGDVEVGRQHGLQAAITPANSRGRWRGHHVLMYSNWGNAPVRLRLSASDPDQRLGFLLEPSELSLGLGGKGTARLTVRTRKPALRGAPERLPFEVAAEPDEPERRARPPGVALPNDPTRPVLTAALTQKPILSRLAVGGGALAAAAAIAAAVLAFKIPKPHTSPLVPANLPHPPTIVAARLKNPTTATVLWNDDQPVAHAINEFVGQRLAASFDVKPGLQIFDVPNLDPGTRYCFAVIAVADNKLVSDASASRCVTTASASGSSSPSGSGSGGPSSSGSGPSSGSGASGAPSGDKPTFQPGTDYTLFIYNPDRAQTRGDGLATQLAATKFAYQPNGLFFTGNYVSVTPVGFPPFATPKWGAWANRFPSVDAARAEQKNCSQQLSTTPLICLIVQVGQPR